MKVDLWFRWWRQQRSIHNSMLLLLFVSEFHIVVVSDDGDLVRLRFRFRCCCCIWKYCWSNPILMLLLLLMMMLFITKFDVSLMLFVIDFDIAMFFACSGFLCCCCCCSGNDAVVAIVLHFRFWWCCCCFRWSRHNRYNWTIPKIEHRIFLPCLLSSRSSSWK